MWAMGRADETGKKNKNKIRGVMNIKIFISIIFQDINNKKDILNNKFCINKSMCAY